MFSSKQISDGFRSLDLFGEPVTVYYNGKSKYQTKIGAFFSIAVFIICAVSCGKYAKRMFNREGPFIQQYLVKMAESEKVTIGDKSIGLQLNFGEFINGIPIFKPIPENFIQLSSFTMDMGSKEIRNHATSQSCPEQEKITDLQKEKQKMAQCFNLKNQEMKGMPVSGEGILTILQVSIKCKADNCSSDQTYNDLIRKNTLFLVSTTERSLNFDDNDDPFKMNQMVVFVTTLERLFFESKPVKKAHSISLELNEAKINDQFWRTPFNIDIDQITTKFLITNTPVENAFMDFNQSGQGQIIYQLQIFLKDKKTVSIRTVYGLFDFLSEMGGIISILFPVASIFLQILQIPRLYLVSLMKQMEPVLRKKSRNSKKQIQKFINKFSGQSDDKMLTLEDEDLIQIVYRLKQYVKFRASLYTRLFATYLPSCLHSTKTKQDILLMKKFENRMKKKLDVRRIMRNDVDLRMLLKQLMSRERYWFFCHQSSRIMSVDSDSDERDNPAYLYKSLSMLRGWKITSILDRRLARGMLI